MSTLTTDHIQTLTLSNNIRLLHVYEDVPIALCGYAINAGTRDELDHEQGLAHFVEHMLFKGTTHRRPFHIINRLESVGGQLDAYTTKEETFIYATIPNKYTSRALDLLYDLIHHSTFNQTELEKEREVILDEIQSYNDSPSELIYDEFEELLFPHDALGRNILGTAQCLEGYTAEDLKAFTKRCHTTDQMVLFYIGDMPFKQWVKLVEKQYSGTGAITPTTRSFKRTIPKIGTSAIIKREKDTSQAHCMMGCEALRLEDSDRVGLILLNNILGGPMMSSRLNISIREHHGLSYGIESSITCYSDTGLLNIYFGCDPKHVKRCLSLVNIELAKLRNHPLTPRALALAQKQILGQDLIGNQNIENRILAIAKGFLHTNRFQTKETIRAQVEAVTSEQLQTLSQRFLDPKQFIHLYYTVES